VGGGPVLSLVGGAPHRRARNCLAVVDVVDVWSWSPDRCLIPGRAGRLTVGRDMRLDLTSSCLRGIEYESKKWRHCWGRCFVFGSPRIHASRHSRLALLDVEAGSNHLHRSPASRKRRRKGNQFLGVLLGHPVPGGYQYGDLSSRLVETRIWNNKIWS
jgi:hypothetical protein